MILVNVYETPEAAEILYRLLAERPTENFISHEVMPAAIQHLDFMASKPFRYWYLIHDAMTVGAIECTDLNEIGVAIFKRHQHKGYGTRALKMFMDTHEPLPPIAAKRNARWLANVAIRNEASSRFFAKNGFRAIQETYAHV